MYTAKDLPKSNEYVCRICKSANVRLIKETNVKTALESKDFQITDDRYGLMLSIFECQDCGFWQCLDVPDTTEYYRTLEDTGYESSRKERMQQARLILKKVMKVMGREAKGLRLLDVGAGSGILLEAASELGFAAEGVEPSAWLRKAGQAHGSKIIADIISHPEVSGPYDVVTLIDVIEHVSAPLEMIRSAALLLKPAGIIVIITPDVQSIAARLMGWKWWHYRIAHIGYFSKSNLELILSNNGFHTLSISRPSWSFSFAYIRDRLLQYLPGWLVPDERQWMHNTRFNLNLRDSLMIIAKLS
jgi:SAM-dependent methyltransferase